MITWPALIAALAGVWVQECRQRTIRSEDFAGTSVVYSERFYAQGDCTGLKSIARSYGDYWLPEQGDSPLPKMDFRFERVTLEPATPEMADALSRAHYCGLTDWTAGVETELTGLKCDLFGNGKLYSRPARGEMRYGIFSLEGDVLRFGKLSRERSALTPETRPLELDPAPFRRQ